MLTLNTIRFCANLPKNDLEMRLLTGSSKMSPYLVKILKKNVATEFGSTGSFSGYAINLILFNLIEKQLLRF